MICIAPLPTLPALYEESYLPIRLVGRKADTLENYCLALKHWADFAGPVPLERIDARLLAAFQAYLLRNHAPASVNSYMRPIKALLRYAAEEEPGLIARAPKVTMLREPRRVPLALTVEEFGKVLAEACRWPGTIGGHPAADWWRAVLLTAWETGLRYKAALSILTVDFLPSDGGLLCRAEAQKNAEGQWYFLPPPTIEAIERILRPAEPLLFHPGVKPEQVGRWFRTILDHSGVYAPKGSGMRCHRVRRSKASYCERDGGNATEALGHSARSVTLRYLDPRIVGRGKQPWMPRP